LCSVVDCEVSAVNSIKTNTGIVLSQVTALGSCYSPFTLLPPAVTNQRDIVACDLPSGMQPHQMLTLCQCFSLWYSYPGDLRHRSHMYDTDGKTLWSSFGVISYLFWACLVFWIQRNFNHNNGKVMNELAFIQSVLSIHSCMGHSHTLCSSRLSVSTQVLCNV
jgi:hypothetical protein